MTTSTMKHLNNFFKKFIVLLLWLCVWQLAATVVNQEILIPTPLSTLKALFTISVNPEFYIAVFVSLLRIIIGYTLGIIVGVLGALLCYKFKLFDEFISPILNIVRAVPVASFIILALVWFHSSNLPIFIAFMMVLPMILSCVKDGLYNIDKKYIELSKVYRLSSIKAFFHIRLPFIMPSFISTSLTALGFAWKSGIAAEVICRPDHSLGDMLQEAKIYISTPDVFAITAVVALLSVFLEQIIKYVVRRYTNVKY